MSVDKIDVINPIDLNKNQENFFRSWCQKVLPAVYDDSLSYYEVLDKVTDYLNLIAEDMKTIDGNIYKWLNEMAENGSLGAALAGYIEDGVSVNEQYPAFIQKLPLDSVFWTDKYRPSNITASLFYELWDELVAQYPDNMRKYTWGVDDFGNSLSYYTWQARCYQQFGKNDNDEYYYERMTTLFQITPGFFVTGAIHGNEKESILAFYKCFKEWLSGRQNGNYILDNFNFVILPCCNPSGFNANTRNNGNDVNINRNFPYGWENYTAPSIGANGKGYEPLDQPEARFMLDILNLYSNANYRHSQLVVSLHCHNYATHADKRVLWYVANEQNIRFSIARIATYLKNVILEEYPELEVNYNNDEVFTRFVVQGSTPDFDNEARMKGFFGYVCETPILFENDEDFRYTKQTAELAYLIVANTIMNTTKECFNPNRGTTFTLLSELGCSTKSSFIDVVKALPQGSRFTHVLSSGETGLIADMPKYADKTSGFLIIEKNVTRGSNACWAKFITTNQHTTRSWETSVGTSGTIKPWEPVYNKVYGIDDIVSYCNSNSITAETITLNDIAINIPNDTIVLIKIHNDVCPALRNEINKGNGVLKAFRAIDNQRTVIFEYNRESAENNITTWIRYYYDQGLHPWICNGSLSTEDVDTDDTISDIIDKLPASGEAIIRVTNQLHGLQDQVPILPGNLTIQKTISIDGTITANLIYCSTSTTPKLYHTNYNNGNLRPWYEVTLNQVV